MVVHCLYNIYCKQAGFACFCGETYGSKLSVSYGCYDLKMRRCTHDESDVCGGHWVNSVYRGKCYA